MSNKGLTIIELIVVVAVISSAFIGVFGITNLGLLSQDLTEKKIEASYLAQEGIEAARSIRDQNWGNISSLLTGMDYFLIASQSEENEWILTTLNPGLIDGIFSRIINIDSVLRDSNDDISGSGASDPNSRKITVKISWDQRGVKKEIDVPLYLTNWK